MDYLDIASLTDMTKMQIVQRDINEQKNVPEQVNPQIDSRIQSCMTNELWFWHFQCIWHPIQKSQI